MANGYARYDGLTGGSSGVTSLNGETGAITLVAGTGISVTPAGQNITIAVSSATVEGPGTSTNNAVPTWNGITGNLLKDNPNVTISSGVLSASSLNILSAGYLEYAGLNFIYPHISSGAVNDIWIGVVPPPSYGGAGNIVLSTLVTGSSFVPTSGFNHNVVIGETNLFNATALSGCVVIGGGSTGDNLTNQSSTILIGYGIANVKASNCIVIGASSAQDSGNAMTGSNNTAIGTDSFDQITSSPNNTSIGFEGFPVLTSGSGFNVGIGYKPGANNLVTGNNNILIGQEMDTSGAAFSNTIAIGHYMQAGASNVGFIGDNAMLFGIGIGTRGSDGSPGSTITPVARLELGAGSTTVPSMVLDSATITTSPVNNSIENDGASLYYTNGSGVRVAFGNSPSMRYFSSSTTISGSLATIVYATSDYDTNNAYSAGTYTVPVGGKYQANASLLIAGTISLNNTLIMEIQKNGSVVSRRTIFLPAGLTDGSISISDIINCAATDTLRIQVSTSAVGPSIVSSNFDNYLSICKVG